METVQPPTSAPVIRVTRRRTCIPTYVYHAVHRDACTVTVLHQMSARVILVSVSSLHCCSNKCDEFWFPPRVVTDGCQGDCVSEMMAYLKVLSQLLSEVTEEQLQRADTGNLSKNKLT